MTSDEFREIFDRSDHILPVTLLDGTPDLAVGLDGDQAILHQAGCIPLEWLRPNPIGSGLFQYRFEGKLPVAAAKGPFDMAFSSGLRQPVNADAARGATRTADIIAELEQAMREAARSACDPGMVTVRIYAIRRLITELERAGIR